MKKVISIKELQYEKLYKEFYNNPVNREMSRHVFFKSDVTYKVKNKIS